MKRYLDAVRRQDQQVNSLFTFLGARLEVLEETRGEAAIHLPVSPKLIQGGGMIAGGVLATLADEAMAHAVMCLLEEGQSLVTAEMNIRYLRAADPNKPGELIAKAGVIKPGRRLMVAEARVLHSDGRLLAVAGGSFQVIEHTHA